MVARDRSRVGVMITSVIGAVVRHRRRHPAVVAFIMLLSITLPQSSHGLTAPQPRAMELAPGVLLVAKPGMRDPRFRRAVILVTAHNADGTMGLIINHPTGVTISQALPQVEELKHRNDPLYIGGPVRRDALFTVLRTDHPPDEAQHIADKLYMTVGVSGLLQVLDAHDAHVSLHSYAGYSGWGGGQLRYEIARGDWLVVEGNEAAVFAQDPDTVWQDLIKAHAGEWI